jgi:excisionase family DNA binding protein
MGSDTRSPSLKRTPRAARDSEEAGRPLTVTVQQACKLTGLDNTTMWKLICEDQVRTTRIGCRRLIFFDSLNALIEGARSGGGR